MPGPSSWMTNADLPAVLLAAQDDRRAGPQYFTALSTRFVTTCSSARRSANARGKSTADVVHELDSPPVGALLEHAQDLRERDAQIERLHRELELLRLDARKIEQVLDELVQAAARCAR